ncbi:hypothetical protein PLICRDRAFT_701456 [Plicaturopsis crispa FD-325 SS-3]|uniref:DUF6534 domain-containing protein n=1 Tax=Plicaturopsis crispa FD-325 SS-3 TaxID=944288 RepID=A0A0C9TAI0_PLICR|nr:hypothetical protein PLICRDRAFT_701456 [Plicaturopsis crispa FD-325 SS-3]
MSDPIGLTRTDLALLLAPYLLGVLFNWALLGCLSVQMYLYSLSNVDDGWGLKSLVYGVYALDILQTAFATYNAWMQLVWSPGGFETAFEFAWSIGGVEIIAGIISCTVQCFFARRIWILKRTRIMHGIVLCITVLAFLQCSSSIAYPTFDVDSHKKVVTLTIWLGGSFLCDILIAGSMLHILREARSRTAIRATESTLTKLIVLTVQTGFITAFMAAIQLIIYVLRTNGPLPANQYDYVSMFMLGELYANVLMATLNARTAVVRSGSGDEVNTFGAKSSQGIAFRVELGDVGRTVGSSVVGHGVVGDERVAISKHSNSGHSV